MKPINELVHKVQAQTTAIKALDEIQAGLELIFSGIRTMEEFQPDLDCVNNPEALFFDAASAANYATYRIEDVITYLDYFIDTYNNIATSEPSGDVDGVAWSLMHKTDKWVRCCRWEWSSSQYVDCDGIEVTK